MPDTLPKAPQRHAPGPRGHFLLGSLPERRREPLRLFIRSTQKHGDIVRFRMGPATVHLLNNPDFIRHVLQDNTKNYCKGYGYDQLLPVFGRGLLTSEGDFWHRQRKLSQPAFHRQRLMGYAEVMTRATEQMLARWESLIEQGTPFDAVSQMMRLTLHIVSETLLGGNVSDAAEEVSASVDFLLAETNRRVLSVFHFQDRLPLPRNRRFKSCVKSLDDVVFRIIREHRESEKDQGDLLSMLMLTRDEETGEGMNDKQLRDEIMTTFLAGHETTANVLAWTFYLLSKHPVVRRKVQEELRGVLGGRTPKFEDLANLPYTSMVIEESMRLYPPAWILARQTLGPDQIGGFDIPARSTVVLSPYVTHRNEKLWPNAEGFDPERFSPEREAGRPKYAYFPFGGGPRVCIGSGFALMEIQLVLATVLQRCNLDLVAGQTIYPEPYLTLRPKPNVMVRAERI